MTRQKWGGPVPTRVALCRRLCSEIFVNNEVDGIVEEETVTALTVEREI